MEDKSILMKAAARMGVFLGLFWVVKYIFMMLGGNNQLFGLIYIVLTIMVPFIAYRCTLIYRTYNEDAQNFSFFHAWQFGILLYAFAALIVAPLHFYYYKNIATPEVLSAAVDQTIKILEEMKVSAELIEKVKSVGVPTPIQMTFQGIANNITIGAILSVPVALLTKKKRKTI